MYTHTMATNFEDLFDNIDPALVDQSCHEKHLSKIADSIPRWEELTPYFDLSDVEVEDIKEMYNTPMLRRRAMLKSWKQKKGKKATYRQLAIILTLHDRRNVAESLCEMIVKDSIVQERECQQGSDMPDNMMKYREELQGVYQTELGYSVCLGSIPSPTHPHVFNLALIGQRNVEYGSAVKHLLELLLKSKVEEILDQKQEVKLENIFQVEQAHGKCTHKFVLLEGAPGAGKSTLACFICQKWGAGELFQEYNLVIFIRLNDPLIQSAKSLAQVFHSGLHFDTQQILSHLQSVQGRGVLFVLDGWDEYSPQLKEDSLFKQLICAPSKLSMQLSSVIVTSRPVASGQLQRFCSARIQVIGFKPEELKRYFQEALNNDESAIAKLEQCLKEKPLIQNWCCNPLNAAVIAHTFLCKDGSLPATMYDLFKELVSTVIQLHMEKAGCTSEVDNLDKLPSPFQEQLESLCKLAYDGVMKNNVTFSDNILKSQGINSPDSMLSLLHGTPSFTGRKQSVFYQFLHLTMQEFLATRHILQLPLQEQFDAFKLLFGQPRFMACFQFYVSQVNYSDYASEFCSFFAHIIKEIHAHIDKRSKKGPLVTHGDFKIIESLSKSGLNMKELFAPLSSTAIAELGSFLQPLSPFDPLHVVLYYTLPSIDVGYALLSCSITQDKEVKLDLCACFSDDMMFYGQLLPLTYTTIAKSLTNLLPEQFPYVYRSHDFFDECEQNGIFTFSSLSLTLINRIVIMPFVSPWFFHNISANENPFRDWTNILIVLNATAGFELENFKQCCQIQ